MRRIAGLILAAALVALPTFAPRARAQTQLRIGMTASDIPLTTGQADNGGEGMRTTGYTMYDALVDWDLTRSDAPSGLIPGLATSWKVDDTDKSKWTFVIRKGAKFHDGSEFTADAAVWNFDKLLRQAAPQFDPRQSAQGRSRIPTIASYRATDPYTLEIVTKLPDAFLPFELAWITMSSPAQWEKVGRSWDKFASATSGTGPWKMVSLTPRERLVLGRNPDYWDPTRVPKTDQLIFVPLPEANARVAALRSGQVDWIEAPPGDAVPSLKAAGFQIVTNAYPHNWTWHLSMLEGSPWRDIRIRKAANLAIDRAGLKELLGGLMIEARGFMPPGSPWFGHPTFDVHYDPAAAKKLMAEAGFGPDHPLRTKILISTSGSGQMQPLPMNEFIQQNLAEIGIKVDFEVMEWNTLINVWRAGAKDSSSRGATGMNYSYVILDPFTAFVRHVTTDQQPPGGTNWGYYSTPDMDALIARARAEFDPPKQTAILQNIHEKFVDDALFIMVAHDVNPRALSPKVHGFVQAQNWYQNFSSVEMR